MLTLLSFLLAFGVSMSVLRYDARRQTEIDEANAIGTSYLRADLLPSFVRKRTKLLLQNYLTNRIAFYNEAPGKPDKGGSARIQSEIWAIAAREGVVKPTVEIGLLISSLNQTFDLREKQSFCYRNHVPISVVGLLYLTSIWVMCLIGYLYTRQARHWIALLSLAFLISATLFVILDLDRPRRGLIRSGPESLLRLENSIRTEPQTGASS